MLERLALAQYRIETGVAERAAPFDAGARDVALDQGKLERQRLNRLPETGQYLGLKPSTSILMKAGIPCRAINASMVVIGTRRRLGQVWPSQPGEIGKSTRLNS